GSGPHESWHHALDWSRRSAVVSLIQLRSPALDEGDDLLHQFGHVDREAPEQRGYWIVLHDHSATSLSDRLRYQVVPHDNAASSPRVSKAAQRDGGRPVPLILDVDRLGYRGSFPVLMLGPGRLQLPHNAMTKPGQDVVHFSHHSPPPFRPRTNEARVLV